MSRTLSRRTFLGYSLGMASASIWLQAAGSVRQTTDSVIAVNGPLRPSQLGVTLVHEHVMVDFIGAAEINSDRYKEDEVFNTVLPHLQSLRRLGCETLVECTPAFLGRNVRLLQRLSRSSGICILTNTGLYGAGNHKYLPGYAQAETAEQLAIRWIDEWRNGIDGTTIKPGFIKSGVDNGPLSDMQRKLVEAAGLTHLQTGLPVGIHTGNGTAALEEAGVLKETGVPLDAFIWIHAQNEKDLSFHERLAHAGAWISFDGISKTAANDYLAMLKHMKQHSLMDNVLISQDAGWYHVGEPGGGKFRDYNYLFTGFLPLLRQNGFTEAEIKRMMVENPARAFTIRKPPSLRLK
ncbi:hypothetical protein [uncultured Chitinophaga sp.]|uniref:phosphotriesterase family protein n=1 Tax=uncultured Chitinophaga sp. TaxID=339340 RepID=UPI0025D5319C|nr:hypothetical protein [uncultured Chitinophaga sp.]